MRRVNEAVLAYALATVAMMLALPPYPHTPWKWAMTAAVCASCYAALLLGSRLAKASTMER